MAKVSGASRRARGIAAEEMRRHNLATVLGHVHLSGSASRSRLTALTGLNRSTVADLIGELTDLGLVTESPGVAVAGPGRPSPVVNIRPEGAVVLAVEISVDSIAAATIGLGGHMFNHVRIARPRGHFEPETSVRDITELARPLLAALPADHTLAAVGVAVVGVVRRADGFLHIAPNLGWRNLPLGALLEAELGMDVPIRIANDADLGALGEYRRGGYGGTSHLVYISGEVGIGCGFISDGKPLLGAAGYAGEAGHMMVNPAGHPCRCGATGCWETEAGEDALLRRVPSVTATTGLAAVEAVHALAVSGDAETLDAIAETGRWLGIGIANLINVFNPEVVILGGLYHRLFEYLHASIIEGLGRAMRAPSEMVDIRRSTLGANGGLMGAAELALADLINDPARVAAGLAVGAGTGA
ncbi:MAG: ROK family protein [Acidimicrobiia bacterium]